ncbi:SH3 domain-containing protein [Devosia sp. RR2S18]|uniref:SH3 domain-containing protein n=1 Tax=Devosia rhizosphaerae TaxID=3049774 RepID=UPI0025417CA1|nr:SH3 domain-containing protein [Devosia sp. RR2S18]WIJ26296.1 SH3 domain-containing protein [Devosia sp. RR2S18]
MTRFGSFFAILALLATALLGASPAAALTKSGSAAWSNKPLVLRSGPGAAYEATGEIAGEVAIKVLRCQRLWCVVEGHGGRGWTSKDHISFGLGPDGPLFTIRPDYPSGGPGKVCFFTGTHYSGTAICAGPGQVFQDLALAGLDNRFASVQVTGDVSVATCRDRFFQSYCERIIASQPVLDRYLINSVSSIRVY